jgi:hypothetical protein|tara:strand:- start:20 stop:841 length:822 start_codon:yes stop_codon:yes gene_type:complete
MATRAGYFPPGYGIPGMVSSPAPFFQSMMAPGILSVAASMGEGKSQEVKDFEDEVNKDHDKKKKWIEENEDGDWWDTEEDKEKTLENNEKEREAKLKDGGRYAVYDPDTGKQIGWEKTQEAAEKRAKEKNFGLGGDGVVVKGDPYPFIPKEYEIPDSDIDEIEKVAPKVAEVLRLKKKLSDAERTDDHELQDEAQKELEALEEKMDKEYEIKREASHKKDSEELSESLHDFLGVPRQQKKTMKDITPEILKLPKKYRGGLVGINELTRGLQWQ